MLRLVKRLIAKQPYVCVSCLSNTSTVRELLTCLPYTLNLLCQSEGNLFEIFCIVLAICKVPSDDILPKYWKCYSAYTVNIISHAYNLNKLVGGFCMWVALAQGGYVSKEATPYS